MGTSALIYPAQQKRKCLSFIFKYKLCKYRLLYIMNYQIGVFVNGKGPGGTGAAKGRVKRADAKR